MKKNGTYGYWKDKRLKRAAALILSASLVMQNGFAVMPAYGAQTSGTASVAIRDVIKGPLVGTGANADSNTEKEQTLKPDADDRLMKATNSNAQNVVVNGSFEETEVTKKADVAKFWKDSICPVGWDNVWDASKNSVGKIELSIDNSNYTEGKNSVHIKSTDKTARLEFFQKIAPADPSKNYTVSFDVKAENMDLAGGNAGFYIRVAGIKVGGSTPLATSPYIKKNTNGWETITFDISDIPKEVTNFQIDVFTDYIVGDIWIDHVVIAPSYTLTINKTSANIGVDETVQLKSIFDTEVEDLTVSWSSSDPDVATVDDNGLVTGLTLGSAVISAQTDEKHIATCKINVVDKNYVEGFEEIRDKWRLRLTNNDIENIIDEDYLATIKKLEADATAYSTDLIKRGTGITDSRTTIWNDLNLTVKYQATSDGKYSADFQTAFERIEKMALAYSTKSCALYGNVDLKNNIIDALEWMYTNVYNEKYDVEKKLYGNWWHWQIGMPQSLCNTVILMYNDLSPDFIEKEAKTLERFNKDPEKVYKVQGWGLMDMTAANLMDTSLVATLRSSIGEDASVIEMVKTAISKNILRYLDEIEYEEGQKKELEGFYSDGSFVQHTNLAYTGGYGSTLLGGFEKFIFITKDSPWELDESENSIVFEWIENGFRPMFAEGGFMDMTIGRGIARPSTNSQTVGRGLLRSIVPLVNLAPKDVQDKLLPFIKGELLAGINYNPDYFVGLNYNDARPLKDLLEDDSIKTNKENYYKLYGAMDKAVYQAKDYALGISMYSKRMASFEYGNKENLKGWHISDGALYLYNSDQSQYADAYWPTVDPMRLAGITTDHTEGTINPSKWEAHTSTKDWVGGSIVSDIYGATGMDFEIENSSLNGKKSWFTFGDEVIALGAGINSQESKATETIVENRKIRENGANKLIVNGTDAALTLDGTNKTIEDASWALLEGNDDESQNIGYYFPEKQELQLKKEARTGSWMDINGSVGAGTPNANPITKNYLSIAIDHGTAPKDVSYSYVLLPGKTANEVEEYAKNPATEILSNTDKVQAVKNAELGVYGFNFWQPSNVDFVTAKTPASVMVEQEGNQYTVGISNPRQNNEKTVITLDGFYNLVSKDDTITVLKAGKSTQIAVDTTNDIGKTHTIKLEKVDEKEFELLQSRLYEQVMGKAKSIDFDLQNQTVKDFVDSVNTMSMQYWNKMNKSSVTDRDEIFQGIKPVLSGGPNSNSANLTETYKYLFKLAQAYSTNGTELYHKEGLVEEILSAIDFTLDNKWYGRGTATNNANTNYYGNWWDHRIGVPAQLLPILVLLDGDEGLTPERMAQYMDAMIYQNASNWQGYYDANLADIAQNSMYIAILQRDAALLNSIKERLGQDMFKYTDTSKSNGWLPDGSYIDHEKYAYTGGYGSVLVGAMSRIMPVLSGTEYALKFNDERDHFYSDIIVKGYLPVEFNGKLVDSISGRSITRQTAQRSSTTGHVALMAKSFEPEQRQYVQSVVKGWLEKDPGILKGLTRPAEIMACKDLLADDTIQAAKVPLGFYSYNYMDKAVQHAENYMAVVSMHSNKIANYESINGEGRKLWNISDGALFLYNNDIDQYRDNYWATIDHLRLPGITTLHDTDRGFVESAGTFNPNTWVSSIGMDNIGITGMQLKTIGTAATRDGLNLKKSYFMFDDAIVAIGSDINIINETLTDNAETVVENRKISEDLSNVLSVNGTAVTNTTVPDATWAHLTGTNKGDDIGYVFFSPTEIKTVKEKRTGLWNDVNTLPNMRVDNNEVSASFATMYIDHGAKPKGAGYNYVILPGKTSEETKAYEANPGVEILASSPAVHAVYEKESKTTGANFFTSGKVSAGKITASRYATVILKETDKGYELVIADPTHVQKEKVTIEIALPTEAVITKDDKITIVSVGDKMVLEVDMTGAAKDKVFEASFQKGLSEEEKTDQILDDIVNQLGEINLDNMSDIETVLLQLAQLDSSKFTEAQKVRLEEIKADAQRQKQNLTEVKDFVDKTNAIPKVTIDNADDVEKLLEQYNGMSDDQIKLLGDEEKAKLTSLSDGMYVDNINNREFNATAVPVGGKTDIRTKLLLEDKKDLIDAAEDALTDNQTLEQLLFIGVTLKDKPVDLTKAPMKITLPLPSSLIGKDVKVALFNTATGRAASGSVTVVPIESSIVGNKIEFTVKQAGNYGFIIGKSVTPPPVDPNPPVNPSKPGGSGSNSGGEVTKAPASNGDPSGWRQNDTGWWLEDTKGHYARNEWKLVSDRWYYFNAGGYMTTGWQKVDNIWYYMNADGSMATGWVLLNGSWYYLQQNGAMESKPLVYNGKTYTFNGDGQCTNP